MALLDAFVSQKHGQMIAQPAAHIDLSAQLAYFDEDHPLRVKPKPSRFAAPKLNMMARRERPKTAPVRRREMMSAMPPAPDKQKLKWTAEVTSGVQNLGAINTESPTSFNPQATAAAAVRPQTARPRSATTTRSHNSRSRPQSGTTRQTISRPSTAAKRGAIRPSTATSRRTVGSATARSNTRQLEEAAPVRRQRPMSAVSLGGVSVIEDDYTDWQDDDDVTVDDGATVTTERSWRHPASVLSSRAGSSVRKVVWCKKQDKPKQFCNHAKYKALTARDSATRNVSITNVGVFETSDERQRREDREAKKKWMAKETFQTTRTQQRSAITNSSSGETHAAWPQFKSHLHDTPFSGSALTYEFRDVDKTKFLEKEGTFVTAVRRADQKNEMASQWMEQEEDDSDVDDDRHPMYNPQAVS